MQTNPSELFPNLLHSVQAQRGHKAVDLFLLHYLQKAAGWDQATTEKFQRPFSPLAQTQLSYHRDYHPTNKLLSDLSKLVVQQQKAYRDTEILLASDRSVVEAVSLFSDLSTPKTREDTFEQLKQYVAQISTPQRSKPELEMLFMNVDALIDSKGSFEDRAEALKNVQEDVLAMVGSLINDDKIKERFLTRFCLFSMQPINTQDPNSVHVAFVPDLPLKGPQRKMLRERIAMGGYTPTMLQARQTLLSLKNLDQMLQEAQIEGMKGKFEVASEKKFSNFEEFMDHPKFHEYMKFGQSFMFLNKSDPKVEQLLASANFHMMADFKKLNMNVFLANQEHASVIQGSLNRLIQLMDVSLANKDNHAIFCLCHELIAEEILLLLNVVQPHPPEEFQEIYFKNKNASLDFLYSQSIKKTERPPPPAVPHMALAFSSGMSCMNAVLRGIHQMKPNASVACMSDNYFETFATLQELNSHSLLSQPKPSFQNIDAQKMPEALSSLPVSPDIVFMDLRSNMSLKARQYQPKDLERTTRQLLQNRREPLTLALDVTLDKMHSKELDRYLSTFKNEIESGKLNIVLYRSAQKFDQLGTDKFNAGYMEVVSNNPSFREAFQNLNGQLQGLDYQAICHFHRNADYEIDEYLKLHYNNSDYAYNLLGKLRTDQSILKLTPKMDEKLYFLEITYPKLSEISIQDPLMAYFVAEARRQGIQMIIRDSFGYNESTLCGIPNKIRLSLGTQSEEEIAKICKILTDLETALQKNVGKSQILSAEKQGKVQQLVDEKLQKANKSVPLKI
ncbi:MAG: hypothetical protein LLG04_11435 [Parachlamydia sp.]|nr:hypothetical protein [Parachlamydia sp.]